MSTPPPPNPAPQASDAHASSNQGGIVRDVSSILANLNQEQLASIVAAARASEGTADGADASSILAALPPGLGQAASALTSFASSFKRSNANEGGEGHEGLDDEQHQHQLQDHEQVKKEQEAAEGNYEHHNQEGDGQAHQGDHTDGYDTADAIAAMSSLSAQGIQDEQNGGGQKGRSKKESGPEAERARKDQHKEVERKRRELISNGITELANIVPGCDAKGVNKTAIINAAVRYIQELKNNEASNIEKWTLEKLLMDQAMNDLNQHLEASRKEIARLRAELGIEGEPEESAYHQTGSHHHQEDDGQINEHGEQLDPNLDSAAREGAANALSEVAAVAAAAAAAVEEEANQTNGDASTEAADVEKALGENKDAPATSASRAKGRGRADAIPAAKEETARSKRARH